MYVIHSYALVQPQLEYTSITVTCRSGITCMFGTCICYTPCRKMFNMTLLVLLTLTCTYHL